jgi:flagellar FliL protein
MAEAKGKEEPKDKDKAKENGGEDQPLEVNSKDKQKKLIMMGAIGGGVLLLLLIILLIVVLTKPSHSAPDAAAAPNAAASGAKSEVIPEESVKKSNIVVNRGDAPIFLAIEPNFTVNIVGGARLRMMQVKVQLMARNQKILDIAVASMPLIQNALVSLFSSKSYDDLITKEGKEALRIESLKTVQAIIQKDIGQPGIEEVLFTSFVMQ